MNWDRTVHIGNADAEEIETEAESRTTPGRARLAQVAAKIGPATHVKPKSKVMPMLLIGAAVIGVLYFMKRKTQ